MVSDTVLFRVWMLEAGTTQLHKESAAKVLPYCRIKGLVHSKRGLGGVESQLGYIHVLMKAKIA